MAVLMNLLKLNEVEYALNIDLKLVNITIGIHRHPILLLQVSMSLWGVLEGRGRKLVQGSRQDNQEHKRAQENMDEEVKKQKRKQDESEEIYELRT